MGRDLGLQVGHKGHSISLCLHLYLPTNGVQGIAYACCQQCGTEAAEEGRDLQQLRAEGAVSMWATGMEGAATS